MTFSNENARRQPGADRSINSVEQHTPPYRVKQRAAQLIVRIALWGLLPIPATDSDIRSLRLEAE
jgi:hypothetical protein